MVVGSEDDGALLVIRFNSFENYCSERRVDIHVRTDDDIQTRSLDSTM